jgi:hypothetical protein
MLDPPSRGLSLFPRQVEPASVDRQKLLGGPCRAHEPLRGVFLRLQNVMSELVRERATQRTTDQTFVRTEHDVESSRRTANQLLSAGLRQMDPAIGSAGRKRDPSQRRLPLGQSVVRILDREGELPLRGLSVDTTGCQSNVMPTGSQIASASAKIRCRSDSLSRAGAVTATDIGVGGVTAIAVAPQVTRVMRVANTVPQFPHTIFAGSLRSPRRRMPTVRAPSSDPET